MLELIKMILIGLVIFVVVLAFSTRANGFSRIEVEEILKQRIDKDKKSVGIVVGVVSPNTSNVSSYGKTSINGTTDVNEKTLFEICSLSKVFTTLLLADMVEKGEVSLNDPISKYLPKSVTTPTRNGKEITLLHLATHTSGLPRLPGNFFDIAKDLENPYIDYSQEHLYEFLSNYKLTKDIGSHFEYSNLGIGLLGHILSLRAGTNYENLMINRICKPLQMNDTKISLSEKDKMNLAIGHNEKRKPTKNWDFQVLAGAGAIRSTVSDMMKFINAYLNSPKTELSSAMEKSLTIYGKSDSPNVNIALGWHTIKDQTGEFFWHNGQTGGYHSYIAIDTKIKAGVVVLSNCTNDIEDIGGYLLENEQLEEIKKQKSIKLDPKVFDGYVGEYELTPNFILTISREGEKYFVKATNQGKLEIVPQSPEKFFLTEVKATLEFVKDENGKVLEVILHQAGNSTPGKKIK